MWTFLLALLASLLGAPAGPVRAEEAAVRTEAAREGPAETAGTAAQGRTQVREQNCLSPADMREVLEAKRVIDPVAAIRAAQAAVPKAEIVRANLCRTEEQHFVYLLTALRRDGHFVHVTVNAESGKVAGLW